MLEADIVLTEVYPLNQHARFYEREGRDFVEISYVGSKDNLHQKVTPDVMARFRAEWLAYKDNRPLERRAGTALSELGLDQERCDYFVQRQVHTLEELEALSDIDCQHLGQGTITARNAARKLLAEKRLRQRQEQASRITSASAALTAGSLGEDPAPNTMLAELLVSVGALGDKLEALIEALAPLARVAVDKPKRGLAVKPAED
jgi:hypothetical protein